MQNNVIIRMAFFLLSMGSFFIFTFLFLLSSCTPSLSFTPSSTSNETTSSSSTNNTSPLKIIAIDIGQGDATLVVTPSGKTFLIDAGPVESGTNVILPLLSGMGIDSIDFFFPSQYDADHIGGFAEVVAGADQTLDTSDDFLPQITYDRGSAKADAGEVFENYINAIGNTRTTLHAGDIINMDDGILLTCFIINGETTDGVKTSLADDDENGHSIGLLLSYGSFRYFTAGDLTGGGLGTVDLESQVAPQVGVVDVLHVNHHGSSSSSNTFYLQTLQPKVALVSVGDGNLYGHPTVTTLSHLNEAGAEIYQTETGNGALFPSAHIVDGSITIEVNENGDYLVNGDEY